MKNSKLSALLCRGNPVFISFIRASILLCAAGFFTTGRCLSQTVLLNETFGTTTTFPTGWSSSTADWTNNIANNSNTYTNASGGANAFFGPTTGSTNTRTLLYNNGLSTVGYTGISVLWGARYITAASYTINLVLQWSSNGGTTWNNVAFTNIAALPASNTTWSLVNNGNRIALPAAAANVSNLMLRFAATYSSSQANSTNTIYRIDDVTVTGCPTSAGTIAYAGSPYCTSITTPQAVTFSGAAGGTYSAAAGLTINAATGAITPATSTAGTYTVTYSLGCGPSTTTTVAIADVPTVSGTTTETCVGGSTGTITVLATGGTSPYTYNLNSGTYQASASFTGLPAATYTVSARTSAGCTAAAAVTVNRFANATDAQTLTDTDAWVGHMYDGTSFTDYIGRFSETENFNETFGGSATCFNVNAGAGARSIYTETMSAKLRMTSSKKGLYTVNLGADDANRLTVDGTLLFNNWTSSAYSLKSNVLLPLTGSSNLLYEYYENTGTNQLTFQGLTLLLANNLTTNTTQTICLGNVTGVAISGDVFGTLPTGIVASGTGYQWSYSTTPTGIRTNITGATTATYTPLTTAAPFNAVGTYYLYRTASLSSLNNTGFLSYVAELESNAAIITVVAAPTATISYTGTPFCTSAAPATVVFSGSSGGTYSAATGLAIDGSTGTIAPGSSTPGTYTVTYTIAATLLCAAFTTTTSVTITAAPTATIMYMGTPFCSSTTAAQAVTRNGTAGGTYSSSNGLALNPTTGEITPGTSTAGTYTVTYSIAASGGCAAATTSAIVTITAAPTATISYAGSPFCSDAGTANVTLNGNNTGSFGSTTGLSIQAGTGAINTNASTPGSYTVAYTLPASGGCSAVTVTAGVVITTAGVWTGAVSSDFTTGGNWLCGSIPLFTTAIVIPSSLARYPVVNGTVAATNISIAGGASLLVKGTLQVAGTLSGSGKLQAADGTVEFTGTAAQSVPIGLLEGALVKNLTISNTAGVSLADTLQLTGILKITAGQLSTGGKLVLKSTATATAMVAAITSPATTPINGLVKVERYVPGRRRYRLITSPVTTSPATTLSSGQEALSIWGAWQNGGSNSVAGNGTFITGGSGADGFDPQTTNASLFTYDDVNRRFTGFTTASGNKTRYTPLKAGVAYYLFVYGDRTNTISTNAPNPTVLSATGTLLTGNQVYTTTSSLPLSSVVGRFTLLGNPFASTINWATVPKTGLDNAYWGWDPNLSGTGGYVTVLTTGSVALQAPYTGSTGLNQYIQPGQGFFVKTTAANPTLTIREQDKVATLNTNAFRTNGDEKPALLAVNLLYNSGTNRVLADGVLAAYEDSLAASGKGNATKIPNPSAENLALQHNNEWLSIYTGPTPRTGDTLRLNLWRLTRLQYTLQIFAQQLTAPGMQAFLYDQYLDTLRPLSLADTNTIAFQVVPGVAASADTNRFRIVFRSGNAPLPVKFISVAAHATPKNIQLSWAVAEQAGIRQYSIEKATNGTNFIAVGTLIPKSGLAAVTYQWTDQHPQPGTQYYRVKALENDGRYMQSETVLAKWAASGTAIRLSPNPFSGGNLSLQCGNMEKGRYSIEITNTAGSRMLQQYANHAGGVFTQVLSFDTALPAGLYHLTITENGSSRKYQPFVVP